MTVNSNWYSLTKGRYFTDTKKVGIDFSNGLFDEDKSKSTLIHETTHAFLCNTTEMGIFLQDVEKTIDNFSFMPSDERKLIMRDIFLSQQSVQEGFSTFFQYGSLKNEVSKNQLKRWYLLLPDSYKEWLEPFLFSFKLSPEMRDLLTEKLISLTMNTHIRKDASSYHLLENRSQLKKYLTKDNSPDYRLKVMLRKIKKTPGILYLPVDEIPSACGIEHFEQISNLEVVDFVKYISTLAGNPVILTENQIGAPLTVDQIFKHVQDNTIVANLNINLGENAEFLFDTKDVLHYADIITTIFISQRESRSEEAISVLRPKFSEEPEISMILQAKSGEKYLHMTSRKIATKLLNEAFKTATLAIKLGDYNWKADKVDWLDNCRPPNLVIYNHYWQLNNLLKRILTIKPSTSIMYRNIGAKEDHPFRTLITKIVGNTPILCVNTLFPYQADEIITTIKDHSVEVGEEFTRDNKDSINSLMIFWTGWDFRIDWVETMLDGTTLHFI